MALPVHSKHCSSISYQNKSLETWETFRDHNEWWVLTFPNEQFVVSLFRACYGVLRFIMESGAKGCEVVVSGKLRGQRAKSMKFVDGLMIHSGDPINDYVDTAVRHVLLRQGKL